MACQTGLSGLPPARRCSAHTIPCHAHPAMDQVAMDSVRDRRGYLCIGDSTGCRIFSSSAISAISLLLRALAGKSADIFLAGKRTTALPDSIHHRSCGGSSKRSALDRWHGVYVRSTRSAAHSIAESVSRGHPAIAAVGDLAFRLRPARLEVSDADCVDRGSDQLFLASAVRCELGPRAFLSRTARRSGVLVSVGLPDHCSRPPFTIRHTGSLPG